MTTRRYQKETNRFSASDDEGTTYTVVEYTQFNEITLRDGTQTVPGNKSLQTTEGHHVNWLAKGKYQMLILDRFVDLRSDNPKAT